MSFTGEPVVVWTDVTKRLGRFSRRWENCVPGDPGTMFSCCAWHFHLPLARRWSAAQEEHGARDQKPATCTAGSAPPWFSIFRTALRHSFIHLANSHPKLRDFPGGWDGRESACSTGELGLIPRSGRSPGEMNGYSPHSPYLENSMDRGAWWATVHGDAIVRHDWTTDPIKKAFCMYQTLLDSGYI